MNNIYIFLINIIIIITCIILSIYSIIKSKQLKIANESLKEAQMYNKSLSNLHDNIRCFKHNFTNIVQAIGGYVHTEDIKGLKIYYSQLLEECNISTNLSLLNPKLINNPAIFNILSSKYYDAKLKNIIFNISIFLDLNTLNIKIYDFTKIMGILLDNAIEATYECNEKIINFTINSDKRSNRQLLIIENTYNNKNIDTEKIYEKAYTTKINNTGLGLWEVRKILNKNNNLNLYTTKDDKFFKQQLEIYL